MYDIVDSTRFIDYSRGRACVCFGTSRRDLSESVVLWRKRAADMAQASIVVLSLADVLPV